MSARGTATPDVHGKITTLSTLTLKVSAHGWWLFILRSDSLTAQELRPVRAHGE